MKHASDNELKAAEKVDTYQTLHGLEARFEVTIPSILSHLKQISKIKKFER